MPKRKTADDYRALAKRRGFTWLGHLPKNTGEVTQWLCSRGHEFSANYDNLKQGMGCKYCTREDHGARRRHPQEDYHALAYERGLVWLGPEVKGALEQTVWECASGHRWSGRYNDIQQGHGCKYCAAQRKAETTRRQPGEYHAVAASRGFTWLGPAVSDNKKKTRWRCMAGHTLLASFNHMARGVGCRKCAGLEPKSAQDFRELATSRGFKWIANQVCNSSTRTTWECSKGHTWRTTYSSIQQGSGCPHCAGLVRKTGDDYRRLAERRRLIWLGPVPENSKGITNWRCAKGHHMQKSYNSALKSGCLECSGLAPKTSEEYHKLASRRGFKWLGRDAPNTHTKTRWMCSKGHTWEAGFSSIQQDRGCPKCLDLVNGKRVSKAQRRICEMVGGELNVPFAKYAIDVTKTVGGVRIAIEYDSWFWHGKNAKKDLARSQKLLAAGWRLLRIRSNHRVPSMPQLNEAIARLVAGERWVDLELPDWGKGPVTWCLK